MDLRPQPVCKVSALVIIIGMLRTAVNAQSGLVVEQPRVIRIEAGESVTISCSFVMPGSGSFSVSWFLGCEDGVSVAESPCHRDRVTFRDLNRQLIFSNLTEIDSGTYCCRVELADGTKGKGNGTRLEVSPKQCTGVCTCANVFILYCVIGFESCVVVILLVVLIKIRSRGSSRLMNEDSEEQSVHHGIHYAEICQKNADSQRSRVRYRDEKTTTYATVKPGN